MLSCRSETSSDDRLALLRLPQVEVGGRLGGVAVEGLAVLVGADRALDQPPGLAGGDVAADLDLVELLGDRHVRAEELGQRLPLLLAVEGLLVVRPRLGGQRPDQADREEQRDRPPLAGAARTARAGGAARSAARR